MAKRHPARGTRSSGSRRKQTPTARSGKRPTAKRQLSRPAGKARKRVTAKKAVTRKRATPPKQVVARKRAAPPKQVVARKRAAPPKQVVARKQAVPPKQVVAKGQAPRPRRASNATAKRPRLDRARRTLDETVPTPPSSLDMNRHGSAVRTGRAVMAETLRDHRGMSSDITAGDVDVDVEDAYFTGEEAPGGDNPTPDQDIVDDIGKALGVEYQDNEPLKASEKLLERDKHRWELDPASSEDYKERKK
jgi:uncharacterized protein DUF6335